jgi:uncharacterized YigZ family protein
LFRKYIFHLNFKGSKKLDDFYYTVKEISREETREKGSVFIATLFPAENKVEAEERIQDCRREFHDATHNCFAFRIDQSSFRYSDDGEPSGTAGAPILSMIDKYDLKQIVLVVTRYFGGTKLGTGGLIRAYSHCAETAIKKSSIIKKFILKNLILRFPFGQIGKVKALLSKYGFAYSEDATPEMMVTNVQIPPSRINEFEKILMEATSGKIRIEHGS